MLPYLAYEFDIRLFHIEPHHSITLCFAQPDILISIGSTLQPENRSENEFVWLLTEKSLAARVISNAAPCSTCAPLADDNMLDIKLWGKVGVVWRVVVQCMVLVYDNISLHTGVQRTSVDGVSTVYRKQVHRCAHYWPCTASAAWMGIGKHQWCIAGQVCVCRGGHVYAGGVWYPCSCMWCVCLFAQHLT